MDDIHKGSTPETCLGCGCRFPDDAAWKQEHPAFDDCPSDCWCRAYCWGDCRADFSPPAIAARARAEAFEEAARIAEGRVIVHNRLLAGDERLILRARAKAIEAAVIAAAIRQRAKS